MYVPYTQSQGYTPGLGSGISHPEKNYVIRFTNKLHMCDSTEIRKNSIYYQQLG